LVRYVGWGGLPQAFDRHNKDWEEEYRELGALLDREEYEAARRSVQDAHYTPKAVIEAMYQGLEDVGFDGGRVLEPASGVGHFIGLLPESLREKSRFTAIELDPLASEIGKHLYPSATHIRRGLQDVAIPAGIFDAVVGNPPFGSHTLYDPHHRDLRKFSIHNYFLAKSLDKLREGGVMAVVVSRYFMDAGVPTAREHIADRAHLLGAVRLPCNAFKRNALTEVTADVLFFQKARAGETPDRKWTEAGEVRDHETGDSFTLNRYYIERPEQIIGRMAMIGGMHGNTPHAVAATGTDLSVALPVRLIAVLPKNVYSPAASDAVAPAEADKPALAIPAGVKIGSFFLAPDGKLARRLPDVLDKQDYVYLDSGNVRGADRIKGMILVRDALRDLMQTEQSEQETDVDMAGKRRTLNRVYDGYVRKFGHLGAQANRLAMGEDPEYPLLHALEHGYDKGISPETAKKQGVAARLPSAKKAAIFERRVMRPHKEIVRAETARDALVVSMNESGRVDIGRMMRLTGKDEQELLYDLSGLIYRNPETDLWETADRYLAGNVKAKLRAAQEAAALRPSYAENVAALEKIQPADIDPIDISVRLGSSWTPSAVVDRFVGHLLGDVRRNISYQESLGKWLVRISPADYTADRVRWGTESYPAHDLIAAILTNQPIQVKVEIGKDDKGNKIAKIDEDRTAAANQKADEIRQAFLDWVWEDKDRRESLARLYNDRFNTNVPARYDGSHLELPGAALGISLRPHQKDAVWRGIQDGTALFDHVVGAGKTLVCVGTIMESRRMGLTAKPMLVVPNHLLLQWKDAFYSLYPQANILVAEKSDFAKENRERLFGRIATGDWDAVIVGHSSFKKIGMPEDTLQDVLQEQINDLTDAIVDLKASAGDRPTIKEMEKARERMQERMRRRADTGAKDKAVSFAELGVDALFVDEAHEFKNLFINTSLNRVSGLGNLTGSEKAFDLFVKCRFLQQRQNGRGVFFATGTPVSNTIAELYTVQRFLQYDDLKARGLVHFDAWASTFGEVVTGWELDATGVNYRLNSRFAKFRNVPELIAMYRDFADVVTKADLDRQAEERGARFPVPRIKGGRPENVVVDRSEAQALFMGVQEPALDVSGEPVIRADGMPVKRWNVGSVIWRMEHLPKDQSIDNALKITNDARKAGLDYRLIDPNAEDDAGSKVNAAVENIHRRWEQWRDRRGTQLAFCDLSTPKKARRAAAARRPDGAEPEEGEPPVLSMDELLADGAAFSVYEDIRAKLVARGVPEDEIRFIHDAETDLQKSGLFEEMNQGHVRILLGSTAKMGAGTNVQTRLVALHHLDAPWRPSDLEQREGRIIRQGNMFYEEDPEGFEVEILRYATRQTYDSRMWQTIEYKASGIEQFRKGDSLTRVIEDVAGEAANAAEMKAAATGNPLILLQVQLAAELKKLEALHAHYKRSRHSVEKRLCWLSKADERADRAAVRLKKDVERRDACTTEAFRFEAGGRVYGEKERDALLAQIASSMKKAAARNLAAAFDDREDLPVGRYRGFDVGVHAVRDLVQFAVTGADRYAPENLGYNRESDFSLNGFIARLDNFMAKLEGQLRFVEETRRREKLEYEKAEQEYNKPFPQRQRLETLRQDVHEVMTELKRMQADDNYVSEWKPQSMRPEAGRDEKTKMRASG
jgi:N12 class adenine-specific DNA methylase/predicted RNA methylase